MTLISIALAGFSIMALILLMLQRRTETKTAKMLAQTLLCSMLSIQLIQAMVMSDYLLLENTLAFFYLLSIGLVGPVFYLYSQHVIQTSLQWNTREAWHFLPVISLSLAGFLFPDSFAMIYSLMFLSGAAYMLPLAWSLYLLRERRTLFKMEFLFTASFLTWSLAVVLTGIFNSQVINVLLPVQTIMLSLLIAAAIHIQLNYPHLLSSLEEIASRQYQISTLLNIDCDAMKKKLEEIMAIDKVYEDTELSLLSCAAMLPLKAHQLSELINTQLGMSFSAYLRYQRVRAAEIILKTEPEISVLAVGLSVGFSSQSAFYCAFKDVHAMAPGQYRRQILTK